MCNLEFKLNIVHFSFAHILSKGDLLTNELLKHVITNCLIKSHPLTLILNMLLSETEITDIEKRHSAVEQRFQKWY